MCPDRFEPLRFVNNSTALGNSFDNSEERDLHVDLQRTVRNFLQNS